MDAAHSNVNCTIHFDLYQHSNIAMEQKNVEILNVFFHSPDICPRCCLHSGTRCRDSDALRK